MDKPDLGALAEGLKASLDATREQTKTYGEQIEALGASNRSLETSNRRHRLWNVVLSVVVVAVIGLVIWVVWDNHLDGIAACEQTNESRASTREFSRDGDVASSDALIETANQNEPVDPELLKVYFELRDQALEEAAERHRADDIDCSTGERVGG